MKRTAIALIMVLSFLVGVGTQVVNLGMANPWLGIDWVSPSGDTKPPTLTILSPQEDTIYNSNNVLVSFNASIGESKTASYTRLMQVYYEIDRQQNKTYVYNNEGRNYPYEPNAITEFSFNMNLTELQEGKHNLTVHAVEWGAYIDSQFVHMFSVDGSLSINFTIDLVSPSVLVLSFENKAYNISGVPLNFAISEPVSQIEYSLDGKENITVTGNTTLTGLASGDHTLTVYATDEAGNVGASETIAFTVAEPFPTTLAVASAVTVTVVVAAALTVYFKGRKRQNIPSSTISNDN